jgi:galactose oxidase-like protein
MGKRRMVALSACILGFTVLLTPTLASGSGSQIKLPDLTRLSRDLSAATSTPAKNPLPQLPQLNQVPGLASIPNLGGLPVLPGVTVGPQNTVTDPAVGGVFSAPFVQPGTSCPGETEGADPANPYDANDPNAPTEGPETDRTAADIACKPAGVSLVNLPQPAGSKGINLLYWDGLEGEESIEFNIVAEYGDLAPNDQSRLLHLNTADPRASTWTTPSPSDGGANGDSQSEYLVPNAPGALAEILNDQGPGSGALFCTDLVILANGEVLVPGGTDYYEEPKVPDTAYGVAELQGLKNTRVFNPLTSTWYQSGDMNLGRWYPSLITLGSGKVFVASGVTKLLKPAYTQPETALLSGTNVEQTETFDPSTGKWTLNQPSADHTLPLFPRLHLLPDGNVYYDAGGQTFNPFGQAYDEALWNIAASYNPTTQKWTDLGIPFGVSTNSKHLTSTAVTAGFRGSSFSIMLPLTPDAAGNYDTAQFLSAGGVLGVSPGAYLANASSVINTVTMSGGKEQFSSAPTGALNNPRWFSSSVLLPTGQVIAFNGGNRDDVVLPGTSFPVTQAEMFNPATNSWSPLASSGDPRTYHNTAELLPTGQVIVGGHSPISTGYAYNTTLPGGLIKAQRDPSFQIYNPPYLEWGLPQPTITSVTGTKLAALASGVFNNATYGSHLTINTPQASSVDTVTLIRNTAITHEVDGDQRSVVVPIISRNATSVTVAVPQSDNVVPPGPYMLFINQKTAKGDIPSVASQIFVGAQSATVPSAKASPGMTAPGYDQLLTNDPVDQLGALASYLDTSALHTKINP